MECLQYIGCLYIVEDQAYSAHEKFIEFPEKLNTVEDEKYGLQMTLLSGISSCLSLREKILSSIPSEIQASFEAFIQTGNTVRDLESWYENGGNETINKIWKEDHFVDAYAFLDKVPSDKQKVFCNYEEAIQFILSVEYGPTDDEPALWLLDREIEGNRDAEIISLLTALAWRDHGIGIIYSARSEDLLSRIQIEAFIRSTIEKFDCSAIPAQIETAAATCVRTVSPSLLIKDELHNSFQNAFSSCLDSKLLLKNLVWVLKKTTETIGEKLNEAYVQAEHGFQLYRLLNAYSEARREADQIALQHVTNLNLPDIDYIKDRAIAEGTTISETLIRIHNILAQHEFKILLPNKSVYQNSLAHIEGWGKPNSQSELTFDFGDLVTKEAFDYHVNALHSPVMTGDIFGFFPASGRTPEFYMLLTQECDCVVRNQGNTRRNASKATLLKLNKVKSTLSGCENKLTKLKSSALEGDNDKITIAINELEQEFLKLQRFNHSSDVSKRIYLGPLRFNSDIVELEAMCKQVNFVEFELLDICALRKDGLAAIDRTKVEEILKEIRACPLYYRKHLEKILEQTTGVDVVPCNFQKEMESRKLSAFKMNGAEINFRICRIARLNPPRLSQIQSYFGMVQATTGLPVGL